MYACAGLFRFTTVGLHFYVINDPYHDDINKEPQDCGAPKIFCTLQLSSVAPSSHTPLVLHFHSFTLYWESPPS